MNDKCFLISVDTEGDDQWSWTQGSPITTENALYLPRFQQLCERFGFKPTYLTNYEMAKDPRFSALAKGKAAEGLCEIGMHLHAWNCPPDHALKASATAGAGQCPYLIEYPDEIMEAKIAAMTKLLSDTFELPVTTHRAGRWAMDGRYFSLLEKYGYKTDCSVTPGVNWKNCPGLTEGSAGSDYSKENKKPHMVGGILEIPMTIRSFRRLGKKESGTVRELVGRFHGYLAVKHEIWLRPNGKNLDDMLYLIDRCARGGDEYVMFMIHSSELMPGGCWRFDTAEKIEKLYLDMESLFAHAAKSFSGMTIGEYGKRVVDKKNA